MTGHQPDTHRLLTLLIDGDQRVARCVCGFRTRSCELHVAVAEWENHRFESRQAWKAEQKRIMNARAQAYARARVKAGAK